MPSDLIKQIKPSFTAGELSPSIWGRTDFAKWAIGASVMRNMFVNYRGPASSRAGLLYCATSLTPASASSLPPRFIAFQFNIFQDYVLEFGVSPSGAPYMRVTANGGSVLEASINVTGATQANPCVITATNTYANGDWVYGENFGGMTQLNGRTFVLSNVSGTSFTLNDLFGNGINALDYSAFGSGTGGGAFARIYTNYNSPYALEDLPYLKVVQSADEMTLDCVNQQTGTEYPPIDLQRLAANNWTFDETTFASSIAAPTGCAATTSVTASPATQYAYGVTAIDATTGDESVLSNIAYITNSDDIATTAGSHTITWNPVPNAAYYNVYQAPPSYDTAVPVGSVFAYIGQAFGNQFVNSNILADQTTTPPIHNNPFARGTILSVGTIDSVGTFTQATTSATINSATGSLAIIAPVVVASAVVAGIVQNGGEAYQEGDTVTFADSGSGDSFIAPLNIGPQTGTYPSVPAYFQSRRVYASTLNNPDTLFLSQTGSYTNMDASIPPVDSDAIVTTPWGQQVNGIQGLQPMPGGLIVSTGLDCWQITGANGAGSALTPASQSAQPQESNGFSSIVPMLKINYDLVYNQSLGYTIRDLQYNFFTNIYAGTDVSVLSNHLFDNFQITSWAFSNIPWKIVWAVRDDGKFLSLTFDKEEQLSGWARHDTNGFVSGNVVATEPPVDVPYFLVKRYIPGQSQWKYYIERMDNRLWQGPEDPWCVDAGLSLTQPTPDATLSAASAEGPGNITGGYVATTGQGYTDPYGEIFDPLGLGSGGEVTFTQTDGAISGFTIISQGEDYSPATQVIIKDPEGAGATFVVFVSQNVLFTASEPVFTPENVGDVIRIGGGQASVTTVLGPDQVQAAITVPIIQTVPNDPNLLPVPAASGDWTITTPVTSVTNLYHLEGMQVTGLADGAVIPLTTVVNGTIELPQAASAITVGLPFTAQLQAMPVEIPQAGSIQGDRKVIHGVNVRMQASRGFQIGANQPVASALDYQQEIPWSNLVDLPDMPRSNVPSAALPLFTGDKFQPVNDDWQDWDGFTASPGWVAAQQSQPLPMNILAFIPKFSVGDNP
jgi:hypothetical protein